MDIAAKVDTIAGDLNGGVGADRNDWAWPHGRQYRPAASSPWAPAVVYDSSEAAVRGLGEEGATAAFSLGELVDRLERPRTAWVMLPAGAPTEDAIRELATAPDERRHDHRRRQHLFQGRRPAMPRSCGENGIRYLDVGTSGGVWGLERGYCMMIGGEQEAADRLDPIFAALAPGRGSIAATPGRERARPAGRAGLHPLRPGRRRPFRQDDP